MIWTTYFAQAKKIEDKSKLISIARFTPKGANMNAYLALAPTPEILRNYKDTGDEEAFVADFCEQVLSKISPAKVAKDLEGKIICCYEKTDAFCHRHIVAQWLEHHGIKCKEMVF